MKKKISGDSRINARRTSFWQYLLYCVFTILTCTAFFAICSEMIKAEVEMGYIMLASVTFLLLANIIIIYLTAFYRIRFFSKPMDRICNAARKVASGDFSVQIEPIRKDGKKDEFEVLFDDFNTMVAELRSVEMLKSDFVSNVSHELKTPLSVIQTYSTMLQSDDLSNAERKEYSAKISDATKRMTDLVTNILQLSRLENQKLHANNKPYVLSEQLCRCTLNFEQVLDEKEIQLETDFDDSIILNSDEQLLDIVFNNLLSNALKFTDNGGRVRIASKSENGCAVVSVADNGCGMNESQIKHIFEKFYQADTSHATKGNGLGLALTYRIVNLLQGSIDVKSAVGQGSLFTVKFKFN